MSLLSLFLTVGFFFFNAIIVSYAEKYSIDLSHSRVEFSVRHLTISTIKGNFNDFSGEITMDRDDISTMSVTGKIQTNSIDSNDAKRDAHLRNEDFFDVPKYPEMSFKSTGIKKIDEKNFILEGTLKILGVENPVQWSSQYSNVITDPWGNEKFGLECHTMINRRDFGMTKYKNTMVGDFINIDIYLEAVLKK